MFETPTVDVDSSKKQEAPMQEQVLTEEERIRQIKDKIAEINAAKSDYLRNGAAYDKFGRVVYTKKIEEDLKLRDELEEELRNTARINLINTPNVEDGMSVEDSAKEDATKLEEVMKKISDIK